MEVMSRKRLGLVAKVFWATEKKRQKDGSKDCYSNNLLHLLSVQSVAETVRQGSDYAAT